MSSRDPRGRNLTPSHSRVSAQRRAEILGHRPATLWLTGLSGSGKSTLALGVEEALAARRIAAYVLDGDNVRHGLSRDLGFSPGDRAENIRRVGEVCRLFHDAGLVLITAFVSPYRADRDAVRALHPPGGFVEVFVDCPLQVCEARDVKGLYRRAREGEVQEFTGVTAPYEPPAHPELTVKTAEHPIDACVAHVVDFLLARRVIGA